MSGRQYAVAQGEIAQSGKKGEALKNAMAALADAPLKQAEPKKKDAKKTSKA